MKCPRCQAENDDRLKFCEECGAPLTRPCPNCGAQARPGKKFCGECGCSLDAPSASRFASPQLYTPKHLAERILLSRHAPEGERKQVTVLFADMKGSMELLADRDPEEARKLLDPVLERMIEAVHRYEGTVNQVMGDGIMALFGAPLALEDHALRACYAALAMHSSIRAYSQELRRTEGVGVRIRIGLNSGEVVVRAIDSDLHMDYSAIGQTTHLAARMEQLADPATTLLTASTLQLVEGFVAVKPQGPIPIKGLAEAVEVYELTGAGAARSRLQAAAARGLTRFVGRTGEMAQLNQTLERAAAGRGEVVALVGEPGVGKSRLVWEVTHSHRVQQWLVLEAGSVSYGKATAYRPIIDLLKVYFQIEERDDVRRIREKVTGKLLTLEESLRPTLIPLLALLDIPVGDPDWERLDPAQKRLRILDGTKRLLLREAQMQPLLLVFEDLHWIDTETQACLDNLVESLPTARVLLLVSYRPEYQNRWTAKTYYTQLRIDPLTSESAEELLHTLLGDDGSLSPLKQLLVERTEGNPLFVEESVRTLVETGKLQGERGAYRLVTAAAGIQVPLTVQAILASRIDRLAPEDKRLLQAAAVIGKDVPYPLLSAIAGLPEEQLRERLAELRASEFMYEASLFPDLEYTFKHALTHEVAYGSMLHERRRDLHAKVMSAIELLYADRLTERVGPLAHHAFRGEEWEKALTYLRQAGDRAFSRSSNREAVTAYEQALAALAHRPETREGIDQGVELRLLMRSPLIQMAELRRYVQCTREAELQVGKLNDPRRRGWVAAFLPQAYSNVGELPDALEQGMRALALSAELDDAMLASVAKLAVGHTHMLTGSYRKATEFLLSNRAVPTGSVGEMQQVEQGPSAFLFRSNAGGAYVFSQAFGAWCLAELGAFEEATATAEEARRAAAVLGLTYQRAGADAYLACAYLGRGDAEAALPLLESCLETSRAAPVEPHQKFCGGCGARLSPAPEAAAPGTPASYTPKHLADKILTTRSALEGERKQVTVLFCDITNSTALAARIGEEPMHGLLSRFFALALEAVHRYEGTVNQFLGDGFMALFGAPVAHEDHARRAALAALEIRRVVGTRPEQLGLPPGEELSIRMGLNSGPVVVGSIGDNLRMDYTAVGDTTNLAARLQQNAEPGCILVSDVVARLVRGYVTLEALPLLALKGKDEPVLAHRLLAVGARRSRLSVERTLSPFVGRERELAVLREALAEAKAGHGQVVSILGEPGVGKSRLLHEFRQSLSAGEVAYAEGWCQSFGQAMPYLPLQDLLRAGLAIGETDDGRQAKDKVSAGLGQLGLDTLRHAPYLLRLLGIKDGTEDLAQLSPETIKGRTLETLLQVALSQARQRTEVIAIEDVHWIDKSSEEFLAALTDSLTGVPILPVTTARPGYSPPWLRKSYAAQLALRVLPDDAARTIVEASVQRSPLRRALTDAIVEKAEGNPLFLEEPTTAC